MAHQFTDTLSTMASVVCAASRRQDNVGRVLLGHGESGKNPLFVPCMLFNLRPDKYNLISILLQVFGTTELPEKPIMLPPFVDSTHCLPYHLTRKGRAVADRVVSVLGYACPDITYSPTLYPITSILLHFMSGREMLFISFLFMLIVVYSTNTLAFSYSSIPFYI